ncbi:MAG: selenocysteine-specific translation elongation factor [Planctomycetes bacterium]|nr:selenocysteine-specific translation elongation factor [Planctomycetota bacterium]
MEYVLIGTAGHVDHGKSTLIKALSGIDPDRLKEEKEREMTIDIGFANFKLPGGRIAQVIDVPGHERFVKNMLVGVNTIDVVLFVVDANEGVKPQTVEHFEILRLLDVQCGIIVLTKMDLAGEERIKATENEIAELVTSSFLGKAPVIKVSSTTGSGISELIQEIDRLAPSVPKRNINLPARYPIDRVFTMSGSGTVVTGTLVSGRLKINDVLEILPQKEDVRVRQIQSYGGKATEAAAGQRIGLNLAGIKKESLIRGNTLAAPGYIEPTYIFDASLEIVSNAFHPLKNNTRVRLHIGTGEFLGRVVLLDKEKMESGERGLIQFRAEEPLVVAKDDRFIIRLYAPMVTMGGGVILDPHPPKHKRFNKEAIGHLGALEVSDERETVAEVLINAGLNIITLGELIDKTNLPDAEIKEELDKLEKQGAIIRSNLDIRMMMHMNNFNMLKDKIIASMEDSYRKQPLKLNIPVKEIKSLLVKTEVQDEFFERAVVKLAEENRLARVGDAIKLVQANIKLTEKQESMMQKVEKFFIDNLLSPPALEIMVDKLQIKPKNAQETINALKDRGILVGLADGIVLHKEAIVKASETMKEYLKTHENIKAGEFTKLINTSRKYAIPLLEHLDNIKLTKRIGDVRILNKI